MKSNRGVFTEAMRKFLILILAVALALGTYLVAFAQRAQGTVSGSQAPRALLVNQPPTVSVGVDQTVTLADPVFLRGVVTDDTLTSPSAILYASWSKISGPGTVTFAKSNELLTFATFSATGSY